MTYSFDSKLGKTTLLTVGLIIGLVILVKGQGLDDLKKFSGVYMTENEPINNKIELTLAENFSIKNEKSKK